MAKNPLSQLHPLGTSVWYDNISRELIESGGLQDLVAHYAVRGITSNPSIFEKAIGSGSAYDEQIASLRGASLSTDALFEEIAVKDIADAADVLKPLFEESEGEDGYVSIEVSPLLASDTEGTINEARRLYGRLERPNIMIKVPGTAEGVPAIRTLLEEGINVNITLLFSVENYVTVAETYVEALSARLAKKLPVDSIASVASFFVSRVDSLVDSKLEELASGDQEILALRGQFGVANSRLAYKEFERIFNTEAAKKLAIVGAKVQRPLWASTSTKNPEYRDVLYVEELIGPHTVNTMPENTLKAFADHGEAEASVKRDLSAAEELPGKLQAAGIKLAEVFEQLQAEGVRKFAESFNSLNETLSKKAA